MNKSGLISPNNEIIYMNYYEIENNCKKIIDKYISISDENKKEFENFSESYHYFKPYFDFVFFNLKYSLINPLMEDDAILTEHNNQYIKIYNTNPQEFIEKRNKIKDNSSSVISKSDDRTLKISYLDYPIVRNGIFNRENMFFALNDLPVHNDLASQILHQFMINSKDVCLKYINYDDVFSKAINFLEDIMGFIRLGEITEDECALIYRSSMISELQEDFINKLIQNNMISEAFIGSGDKDKMDKKFKRRK